MIVIKTSDSKERIKLLVKSLGWTQKELAQKSGVRESSISNYVKGISQPNQTSISKIAQATNVSPSWLMGYGENDKIERI